MKTRFKQYLLIAIVMAAGYFVLSNHFIFEGMRVYLLKKNGLNLHYTFYSITNKKPETIIMVDNCGRPASEIFWLNLGK
jgi:hypothetical protein